MDFKKNEYDINLESSPSKFKILLLSLFYVESHSEFTH